MAWRRVCEFQPIETEVESEFDCLLRRDSFWDRDPAGFHRGISSWDSVTNVVYNNSDVGYMKLRNDAKESIWVKAKMP